MGSFSMGMDRLHWGFIKGGDASAWSVFEITAFLLQTFPLSLPPFFTADLLLIAAHHGREGHQNG
jgi:hypothetical protein